jgi:DNA-binding transcriptional LysR family regulator
LRANELDVALLLAPLSDAGLRYTPLLAEPLMAALPQRRRWPLRLPVKRLANEPFILFPRPAGIGLYDLIISTCRAAGFTPQVAQEAVQMTTIVSLVAAGLGVALVPQSLRHMRRTGVVYRPLAPRGASMEMGLAWRADEPSRAVATFVAAVGARYSAA